MATINFITKDGDRIAIATDTGESVMQIALAHSVPGIEAICGGYCSCATCHVYIGTAWLGKLPPILADEDEMLEGTSSDRQANSRLACQIKITEDLHGIEITLPPVQL